MALSVYYEGRVQGVGFRYTVRGIAKEYDVVGWVKNLPDGRVELLARGDADEVRAFLNTIKESELNSYIRNVEEHPASISEELKGFEIRQ